MRSPESTILWVLFWLIFLTLGDPDILDMLVDLLGALAANVGG